MAALGPGDASYGAVSRRRRFVLLELLNDRRYLTILLILPVLIFFIIWNTIPVLWLIGLSFYKYSLTSGMPPEFIGLGNFLDIFGTHRVWLDLSRTFIFVAVGVSIETILGILLGLLFWGSKQLPGRRVALTLLFAPMVLTPVASGTFFRLIYNPTFGVVNPILNALGIESVNLLGHPQTAFWSVLAVDIWMWTPFMVLMTLAALGSVPDAEMEAAEIDRIPWRERLRLIVFHHGKFILILGILLRTIESIKTMDLVYLMTQGGPGTSTQLVAIELYRRAFQSFSMGWSAALAAILLLISIALTSAFIFILQQRERREVARS